MTQVAARLAVDDTWVPKHCSMCYHGHTGLMVILFPVFSALGGAGVLGALYGRVPLDIHTLHHVEAVLLAVGAFVLATYLTYLYADPFLRPSAWEAIVGRLRWVRVKGGTAYETE